MLQQSLVLVVIFQYAEFIAQPNVGHIISSETASRGLRIFWFKPNVICIIFVPYFVAHISVFQQVIFIYVCF